MRVLGVILLGVSLSACAVTRQAEEPVRFQSKPSDAKVTTSIGMVCRTPCTMNVGRKKEFTATMTKAGYKPQTVEVKTGVSGLRAAAAFTGSAIGGGIIAAGIGAGIGVARGDNLYHTPNPVFVDFKNPAKTTQADPRAQDEPVQ